jgi:hypothetical protein
MLWCRPSTSLSVVRGDEIDSIPGASSNFDFISLSWQDQKALVGEIFQNDFVCYSNSLRDDAAKLDDR